MTSSTQAAAVHTVRDDAAITAGEGARPGAVHLDQFRAERRANRMLARIRAAAGRDQLTLVQALILDHGLMAEEFSANDFRPQLPDLPHGLLGAAVRGLAASGAITATGRTVPSTSPATHGHRISVYRITATPGETAPAA
ncbi:hypothetical protein LE181_02095 [Streptomyces sp. SCA3-4]|uniref:hypothetical protein n=1 Tax=Streptomyces sichuanensis TaxID=2871810 RepID=UPI001CE3989A|nr:hypothetical protein [Streptomyces sichuanensis]MCA6090966.1 hypothetical protein [Streptomyces sichuanensis]